MPLSTANPFDDPVAIRVRTSGSSHSLKFTRKTTLRQTLTRRVKFEGDRSTFWALRDGSRSSWYGQSLAVIGPERRRQRHAPPGPRRDHHASAAWSRSTAHLEPLSLHWAPASTAS
jgi:hypothetical protein